MGEGRVLYADNDHVHVLRYVGDIRHPLAPSVSRFVDTLLERFGDEDVVVDLSEVDAIDSTNLGEIARIAVRSEDGAGLALRRRADSDLRRFARALAADHPRGAPPIDGDERREPKEIRSGRRAARDGAPGLRAGDLVAAILGRRRVTSRPTATRIPEPSSGHARRAAALVNEQVGFRRAPSSTVPTRGECARASAPPSFIEASGELGGTAGNSASGAGEASAETCEPPSIVMPGSPRVAHPQSAAASAARASTLPSSAGAGAVVSAAANVRSSLNEPSNSSRSTSVEMPGTRPVPLCQNAHRPKLDGRSGQGFA
jgi:hypothetical protein